MLDVRQHFRKEISKALLFAWSRFWSHFRANLTGEFMHKNLSSIKKVVCRQLIQKSFSFLFPFMLNNIVFSYSRYKMKHNCSHVFFFCFSKLSLFIWLFVEERIAKMIHRWLFITVWLLRRTKNKPTLKGFRKRFSHSIPCLEY